MLPSAGNQYKDIKPNRAVGDMVTKGTSQLVKGIAKGRKIKNQYVAGKYGQLRKNAEALRDARDKQAQSLMAREQKTRAANAAAEMQKFEEAKATRQVNAVIRKKTKRIQAGYPVPNQAPKAAGSSTSKAQMNSGSQPKPAASSAKVNRGK